MRARWKLLSLIGLLSLGACSTTHEFRVASVGEGEPDEVVAEGSEGPVSTPMIAPPSVVPGTGVAPGSASGGLISRPSVIVASGNVLLGSAGQLSLAGATKPLAGVAAGTVSGVLLDTSQTVVTLADGGSILVDGTGGMLGDAVSIDLSQGQVVGGPAALVGRTLPGAASVAGRALSVPSLPAARGGSATGRTTSVATVTLPSNLGKTLVPTRGAAAVIQPVVNGSPVNVDPILGL